MLHLHRSETGMFVLVDPRSGTVVTGEDLEQLHAEMLARRPTADVDAPDVPRTQPARRWTRPATILGLLVLAALPFVWLSVLHYSLGRMLADLRPGAPRVVEPERGEDDPVVVELKRLHQLVAALQSRVDAVERASAKAPAPDDEDEGEDGDDDDAKADDAKADDAKAEGNAPSFGAIPGVVPRRRPGARRP